MYFEISRIGDGSKTLAQRVQNFDFFEGKVKSGLRNAKYTDVYLHFFKFNPLDGAASARRWHDIEK